MESTVLVVESIIVVISPGEAEGNNFDIVGIVGPCIVETWDFVSNNGVVNAVSPMCFIVVSLPVVQLATVDSVAG